MPPGLGPGILLGVGEEGGLDLLAAFKSVYTLHVVSLRTTRLIIDKIL